MRNQPFHPIFQGSDPDHSSLIDPPARVRLRGLAVLFVVAALIILGRIGWIQANLQEPYLAALNVTTVEHEVIPARDGRILGQGAEVFATDVDQYSVQVHYRWLQEPVDESWLNRQMRKQLTRKERRDEKATNHFRETVLQQRQQMWSNLIHFAAIDAEAFATKQSAIQERVQRVSDSVNRRHMQPIEGLSDEDDPGPLLRFASAVRRALTTTPRRKIQERIVVREEEAYHEVIADVPLKIAARIREQSHDFPGVRVVVGNRRTYPLSSVAAHAIGARTKLNEDEVASKESIAPVAGDQKIGRFGVEYTYNHQLQGISGLRRIERNRRQEIIASEIERQPVGGRDVVLTLNAPLQIHAEQLLAEALLDQPVNLLAGSDIDEDPQSPQPVPTGGCILVMESATGRLLAVASAPAFPLSLFTGATSKEWDAVNRDQRHPFLARFNAMAIPPGSVMKPISAVAAIESGSLDPDAQFYCQGYLQQPDKHRCLIFRHFGHGHNDITLTRAIAQSCNVYFFAAAQRMGFDPLRHWCDKFGLGRRTNVDLPFEKRGHLPGTATTSDQSTATSRHTRQDALGLAIGQSRLTVTPLQIVRAMAAIANGGWLVTPHVVSSEGLARTTSDVDDQPRDLSRRRITGLHESTLERIREGLTAVVQQPYGSGYQRIRLEDVNIAGKTGTAETSAGKADHAWFAGYTPAESGQYTFVVVLEHGGSGGRAAGPVARELVRKMRDIGLL